MNDKELIIKTINKLLKYQYMYDKNSLELNGKVITSTRELARIYRNYIEREIEENDNK